MPNLKRLDLDKNYLTGLPANLFENNPELQFANFLNNRIRAVPESLFAQNPNLEVVWFSGNMVSFQAHAIERINLIDRDCRRITRFYHLCLSDNESSWKPVQEQQRTPFRRVWSKSNYWTTKISFPIQRISRRGKLFSLRHECPDLRQSDEPNLQIRFISNKIHWRKYVEINSDRIQIFELLISQRIISFQISLLEHTVRDSITVMAMVVAQYQFCWHFWMYMEICAIKLSTRLRPGKYQYMKS